MSTTHRRPIHGEPQGMSAIVPVVLCAVVLIVGLVVYLLSG